MIKSYKLFLENFSWQKDGAMNYRFHDHLDNEFSVEFERIDQESVELKYYFIDEANNQKLYKIVNSNPYKIVSIVLGDILIDFIKNNSWCNEIYIVGLSKDQEKDAISQRTKLYLRYLTKNAPVGFSIDRVGNEIILYRNKLSK